MSQWSHLYNNRKWEALRKAQLSKEPLCADCQRQGKVTEATVCDHVNPHKGNLEAFWAGPFESRCKYHHDVKTIMEDGGLNSAAQVYPTWLPAPACPVVLVTGPPGAGKTTWAKGQAGPSDVVIDLDDCFFEVSGVHGHEADKAHLHMALKLRNKQLANLAGQRTGKAFVIVSAPAKGERQWWVSQLGAQHQHLDPGQAVCEQRLTAKRRPLAARWYAREREGKWTDPQRRTAFDADGLPTDPSHHWN